MAGVTFFTPASARCCPRDTRPPTRVPAFRAWVNLVSMSVPEETRARAAIERVYREESRRVFATLVRLLGDFDLAEEALHDAFTSAMEQWPREGVPANPRAW